MLGLDPNLDLDNETLVAASPHPVRNRELRSALRQAFGRPGVPTPAIVARLGSAFLRTDTALGLTGGHATSERLDGFTFEDAELLPLAKGLANAG